MAPTVKDYPLMWVFVTLPISILTSFEYASAEGNCFSLPKPVDLSHALDEGTVSWNKSNKFQLVDRVAEYISNTTFYATNNFQGAEHSGTHIDAPYHFNEKGWKVADIPLDHLISSGIMVDVSALVNESDFQLLPEHLEEWEKEYGKIESSVIILINFGWSSRYGDRAKYFGSEDIPYSFPGISAAAAERIVKNGKIRGVGVDTPSLDYGKSTTFPVHNIISKANLFGLENINLFNKSLPAKNFQLIVLPMKIREGSGAPCRIVAV